MIENLRIAPSIKSRIKVKGNTITRGTPPCDAGSKKNSNTTYCNGYIEKYWVEFVSRGCGSFIATLVDPRELQIG